MTRFSAPVLALLVLAGCGPGGGTVCTEEARASAIVEVVDAAGDPAVAVVTAVDAAGNAVEVMCADGDTAACTTWTVGYEVEGTITVTATVGEGCEYTDGSVVIEVPLTEDGCHVDTQQATLALGEYADCG